MISRKPFCWFSSLTLWVTALSAIPSYAQDEVSGQVQGPSEKPVEVLVEDGDETESSAAEDEAALTEDPDAVRRALDQADLDSGQEWPTLDVYGSVRIHGINHYDEKTQSTDLALGDGASRAGLRADWNFSGSNYLFARGELGFNVLDTFSPKADTSEANENDNLQKRLLYVGYESDNLLATYGKKWSTYYQIAGMTDRFSIFGGSAAGVYNAGTDGGAFGTGRADDVLQARIYTPPFLDIKPFNLNLQYQNNQPIPHTQGRKYGQAYGASAWLESNAGKGIGLAIQKSNIDYKSDPIMQQVGIDGDALAAAVSLRAFGDNWYGAFVFARLDNVETTNLNQYISGKGSELYIQWQVRDDWWIVGGGNWLDPDDNDPESGEYEILYGVIGLRYSLDSFNRMFYAEYKIEGSTLVDGTEVDNEFTVGFRWDFGY